MSNYQAVYSLLFYPQWLAQGKTIMLQRYSGSIITRDMKSAFKKD